MSETRLHIFVGFILCHIIFVTLGGVLACEDGYYECSVGSEYEHDNKRCIHNHELCDDFVDCINGEDETIGCQMKYNCTGQQFLCANHKCIPILFRCDGVSDCDDGSDEKECGFHHCSLHRNKYLCKFNGQCLDYQKVCDNVEDCVDGSDEGALCNATVSDSCPCDRCMPTPEGIACDCKEGYKAVNNTYCEDIDECSSYEGLCDQTCINLIGSYKCSCREDEYILDADGRTCNYNSDQDDTTRTSMYFEEIQLVYVTQDAVKVLINNKTRKYSMDTCQNSTDVEDVFVVSFGITMWAVICVVPINNTLLVDYFTVMPSGHDKLKETQTIRKPEGCNVINQVTGDWMTHKFYFLCNTQDVIACSYDLQICYSIYSLAPTSYTIEAIALSPPHGLLFMIELPQSVAMVIKRASMNGTQNVSILHDTLGALYPKHSLVVDEPTERVFFFNIVAALIESIKFDGTGRKMILNKVYNPITIAVFENEVFWTERRTNGSIQACNKNMGTRTAPIVTEESTIKALVANTDYRATTFKLFRRLDSPCLGKLCSDMCLLTTSRESELEASCTCPPHRKAPDNSLCQESTLLAAMNHRSWLGGGDDVILFIIGRLSSPDIRIHRVVLPSVGNITAMAYNPVHGNVMFYNPISSCILAFSLSSQMDSDIWRICNTELNITSMEYDAVGNNLFLLNKANYTVEVLSLNTNRRRILVRKSDYVPIDFSLDRTNGLLYVLLNDQDMFHTRVSRYSIKSNFEFENNYVGLSHFLSNSNNRIVASGLNRVYLYYPGMLLGFDLQPPDIAGENGNLTIMDFIYTSSNALADITFMNNKLYYTSVGSARVEVVDFKVENHIDLFSENQIFIQQARPFLAPVTQHVNASSPCFNSNGNCDHICIASNTLNNFKYCLCADDYVLDSDGLHCHDKDSQLSNVAVHLSNEKGSSGRSWTIVLVIIGIAIFLLGVTVAVLYLSNFKDFRGQLHYYTYRVRMSCDATRYTRNTDQDNSILHYERDFNVE